MPTVRRDRSSAGICRILIVVVGVAVLGIGLYSHFQSAWVKTVIRLIGFGEIKPYQMCETFTSDNRKCPHIAMERFYVSVIVICFLVSLLGLILSLVIDTGSACFKVFDTGYHAIAALFLLAAAVAYIFSAEQINEMVKFIDGSKLNFRRTEKLIAGGLTIFQGVLYGVTAIVIAKS